MTERSTSSHQSEVRQGQAFTKAARVAAIALVMGVLIMVAKLVIFVLTNSAAVLGDALESIVNITAAIIAITSTWYAHRPPDREHPYGHGRVEFVSVAAEGLMVAVAGVLIAYEGIKRLVMGSELGDLSRGIMLLGGVAVAMAVLGYWVYRRGVKLSSPALRADGKHILTDALTTVAVIVGLIAVRLTGLVWLDPVTALVVSGLVLLTGVGMIRESWSGLIDRMDPADDEKIRSILDDEQQNGHIISYHKVRHRHSGGYHWVDLHLQVPGEMTVREAHETASRIEYRIEQSLGQANATAHVEPPEAGIQP